MTIIDFNEYKQRKIFIAAGDRIRWHDPIFEEDHDDTVICITSNDEMLESLNIKSDNLKDYWIHLDDGATIMADLFTKKLRA
jgi:hypothetical protein